MSKKTGRPKLPKGESKELFAFRVPTNELKGIERAISNSGMEKAEWGREAVRIKARPLWIICRKWGQKDLDGKTVEFRLSTPDGQSYAQGIGRFFVLQHRDGMRLAIEIQTFPPIMQRFFLDEQLADCIERHSDASLAEFRCFATVAGLTHRD
jgi:hypothetical protein